MDAASIPACTCFDICAEVRINIPNMDSNQDLLLCENKYYLEKNKLENVLNFKNKDKKSDGQTLKTETVPTSDGL